MIAESERVCEDDEDEFQSGYNAGHCIGILKPVLKALEWDDWGEPRNEWQRGFASGYQERWNKKTVEEEK